jgi:hypothetical protein
MLKGLLHRARSGAAAPASTPADSRKSSSSTGRNARRSTSSPTGRSGRTRR